MQNDRNKFKEEFRFRCKRFTLDIINLTNKLPNVRSSWVIGDQLLRSSSSIGANVVEARASSSKLEFKKFFEIALKSANESVYWLEILIDGNLAGKDELSSLLNEAKELACVLGKSVIKLKEK